MSISETCDASSAVGGGRPGGGLGQYIEGLKDQCGLLISSIDWAVDQLTGWSLLEALFKPIAGDFDALASMQKAWGNVGTSLGAVGDNYRGMLYAALGIAVFALASGPKLFDTGAGTIVWFALVGGASYMAYAVFRHSREY